MFLIVQFSALHYYYPNNRKEKGLSQVQLADQIGISRTHMSRIENNDCAVSLDVIFSIAKALEIPVSKLFEFR
ncbi:MAG: helix-turn-helix domain-containing protein [Lachnospiraceae bacterium]